MAYTSHEDRNEWVIEQMVESGLFGEDEVQTVRRCGRGMSYFGVGFICFIFVITIPLGLLLVPYGALKIFANWSGRKRVTEYEEVKAGLMKEWNRRKESGEALYEPVDDEWWEGRIKEEYRPPHLTEDVDEPDADADSDVDEFAEVEQDDMDIDIDESSDIEHDPTDTKDSSWFKTKYESVKVATEGLQAKYGGIKIHLVLALLTGWWTFGIGNLLYAAWSWRRYEPSS
jgi:hypothetical protein